MPLTDDLGRPYVSSDLRAKIDAAFTGVTGRGSLIVIADDTGTRGHLAAKLGDHWKVAAGGGFDWHEKKPSGFVGVQATW